MESYLTDNVPDTTITILGYVLSHWQDGPSRGGSTVVYSQEGVALGVLNIDTKLHEVSWLQVKHGQGNMPTLLLDESVAGGEGTIKRKSILDLILTKLLAADASVHDSIGLATQELGSHAEELYPSTICNLMTQHMFHSTITIKPRDQPWFNGECRKVCQLQHWAYMKTRCQHGEVPEDWRMANIVSLFKKGNRDNP
eukprot:g43749.t1